MHDGARPRDFRNGLLDRLGSHSGVETLDGGPQSAYEKHLRLVVATECSIPPERLGVGIDRFPAQLLEQLDCGLLDELVLAVATCRRLRHAAALGMAMSKSVTLISPLMRHGSSRSRIARAVSTERERF